MKFRLLVLVSWIALSLLTFGSGLTFAHHSASATYIHGKSVKIEGTLKEFIWRIRILYEGAGADEKGRCRFVIEALHLGN